MSSDIDKRHYKVRCRISYELEVLETAQVEDVAIKNADHDIRAELHARVLCSSLVHTLSDLSIEPLGVTDCSPRSVCDSCGESYDSRDPRMGLSGVKDLAERLDPGGRVPFGECPSCGSFCYLEES